MNSIDSNILIIGILLLAAVLASKLADRLGVPALLLFLGLGMLAGSEGIGRIEFDAPGIAQAVGTIALTIILFSGGLDTDAAGVRKVLLPGLVLSTFGVLVTALLLSGFAWFVLGTYSSFDVGTRGVRWIEAFLLASIVSSTDAAAVFSVFRTSTVQPRQNIRHLLEFESGSNDPMAVLLTITVLDFMIQGDTEISNIAIRLITQLVVGVVTGGLIGFVGVRVIDRLHLSANGLYPMLVLSLGLISFGVAYVTGGNGFLAVYVAGVVIGNGSIRRRKSVLEFHDGLSWLAQITMFIVLGLLVYPSRLTSVAAVAVAMSVFLMLIARPVGVLLCLLPFRLQRNELAYISWVGMRGSVPIVLATFPISYGLPDADAIFNVIFFIVMTSVLIQGLTLVPCARWLGVSEPVSTLLDKRSS